MRIAKIVITAMVPLLVTGWAMAMIPAMNKAQAIEIT
jgi:hypothetical protein